MTNGENNTDMRRGRCGVCGGDEVYAGEMGASGLGVRQQGGFGGKGARFDAYVCGACGHTQLHLRLTPGVHSYLTRRLDRVPPAAPR